MDKLTRSVLIAQAAGMSYGQYMALRADRNVGRGKKNEDEETLLDAIPSERECAVCGKTFSLEGRRSTSHCCSPECGKRMNAIRVRDAARAKHGVEMIGTCQHCGKTFMRVHGNERFCSEECRYKKRRADQEKSRRRRKEKKLAESH